jgi:hypothetical protein
MAFASFVLMPGVFIAVAGCEATPDAFASACREMVLVQSQPWSSGSRGYSRPPPPAPRSSNSGTVVLPRVPYDNRLDRQRLNYRDNYPGQTKGSAPESQKVVPAPPPAGGNPAGFLQGPADNPVQCEWLRRLMVRTGRLYWVTRYEQCLGTE